MIVKNGTVTINEDLDVEIGGYIFKGIKLREAKILILSQSIDILREQLAAALLVPTEDEAP